jgi:hypothetical protein
MFGFLRATEFGEVTGDYFPNRTRWGITHAANGQTSDVNMTPRFTISTIELDGDSGLVVAVEPDGINIPSAAVPAATGTSILRRSLWRSTTHPGITVGDGQQQGV